MAFSIAAIAPRSNGWITSSRGSGTEKDASWLSGDSRAVVVDRDPVEQLGFARPLRSDASSSWAMRDGALHLLLGVLQRVVDGHPRSLARLAPRPAAAPLGRNGPAVA